MASFEKYQTNKGERWLIKIAITDPATHEKRRTSRRGFLRLADAKLAAKQIEAEELKISHNLKAHHYFKNIFAEFELEYSKHLKRSTIYRKSIDIHNWILPTFGEKKLNQITKKDCQKYIDFMATQLKAYKPIIIQAKNIFDYAVRNNYIEASPFENTVYPKNTLFEEDNSLDKFWDKSQSIHFLDLLKNNETLKIHTLFRTLLLTGLRKGELLALQEKDLNTEKHTIHIEKTLFYDNEMNYLLMKPKTPSSVRTIHLDDETYSLLTELIRQNKKLRLQFGVKVDHKFIFIKEKSFDPFRNSYVNEVLNRICKKYKLPRITVHGLRHSCASLLFAAGADIKVVQKLLGHSHIETTMNIYTHVTAEQVEETTDLLINYLNEPKEKSSCNQSVTKTQKTP